MAEQIALTGPPGQVDIVSEGRSLKEHVYLAAQAYFAELGYSIEDFYDRVLAEVEEPLLRAVMEITRYNQSKAARLLGMSRGTLRIKLKQNGLIK